MNIIGDNIRRYREHNNLTQEDLANYLKCSRELISYYENGNRKPSVDTLLKISNLFGIELEELLEESFNVVNENLVLAFRKEESNSKNLEEIASFKKIIKNYLKMERLVTEYGL